MTSVLNFQNFFLIVGMFPVIAGSAAVELEHLQGWIG
jgi:hypothetical protein